MSQWRHILILSVVFFAWMPLSGLAAKLQITHVSYDPLCIEPGKNEKVTLTCRVSEPAKVTFKIYDSRNALVRQLGTGAKTGSGDHTALWDGKDNAGKTVPPNFYVVTVTAVSPRGGEVLHDLTDFTGGKPQKIENRTYDPVNQVVTYVLPKASIVNVRAGLADGGPLLATLVDWAPRKGGLNTETWNGWDASRCVNLKGHEKLQIDVSAYSLPSNIIIVKGKEALKRPEFIGDIPRENQERKVKVQKRKEMYNHWKHPRDRCYDPTIQLSLPANIPKNKDGLPVISGPVPIRMEVTEEDRQVMVDQRFEVVYYVDFMFIYEEELGYTPFSWVWNPAGVNEGLHYLTVMLRGYEGHFGTATLKVFIKTNKSSNA